MCRLIVLLRFAESQREACMRWVERRNGIVVGGMHMWLQMSISPSIPQSSTLTPNVLSSSRAIYVLACSTSFILRAHITMRRITRQHTSSDQPHTTTDHDRTMTMTRAALYAPAATSDLYYNPDATSSVRTAQRQRSSLYTFAPLSVKA